jgi:hypothetical protein
VSDFSASRASRAARAVPASATSICLNVILRAPIGSETKDHYPEDRRVKS